MIIDFHTHAFSEKIVEKAMGNLTATSGIMPYTDGTVNGLLEIMNNSGVDKSVVLPIATKPSQQRIVNSWAKEIMSDKIYAFGSVHPDAEDALEELDRIKESGFYGVKLHPDYQDMYFDNIRYERIIDAASELGLITVVHAGVDPKCPEDVHCTPEMARKVLDDVKPEKLVLAHMGGNEMWDDVERYLVGQNVYFDTGVILNTMPQEQFLRIVHMHGADRILFGTDSPWADQKKFVEILKEMPLEEEERNQIFAGTAVKLLGL